MNLETFKKEILHFASLWQAWHFVQYNKQDPEAIGITATFVVNGPKPSQSTPEPDNLNNAESREDFKEDINIFESDPSELVCVSFSDNWIHLFSPSILPRK